MVQGESLLGKTEQKLYQKAVSFDNFSLLLCCFVSVYHLRMFGGRYRLIMAEQGCLRGGKSKIVRKSIGKMRDEGFGNSSCSFL